MFDVGFFELVLVFVIALLVLGPERLPVVARKLGYWSGRARAAFNNLRYELEREAHNRDMQERFRRQMQELGIDEETFLRQTSRGPEDNPSGNADAPRGTDADTTPDAGGPDAGPADRNRNADR